jgi:CheY-like chemotaxis protein
MRKILLADDSLTIQKVVELTFMDENYDVQSVRSAEEALARLDLARPDILVADIHVPGASGYELCRAARDRYGDLPVLLLVGTFEVVDEELLAGCGAAAHLKKPFDSQELLRTVQELTAGAAQSATEPGAAGPGAEADSEPDAEPEADVEPAAAIGESWARPAGFETTAHGGFGRSGPVAETPATPAPTPVALEAGNGLGALSDADVDRIARRVAELVGADVLREVAWDVVPDLAEVVVKERLRELESQLE